MQRPTWSIHAGIKLDLICSSPAGSPVACRPWCPSPCCTKHRRTRVRKSRTSTNAVTRFRGSRWARKPMGTTCCPKITARCTSSLRPQFTNWCPNRSWAVPRLKERSGRWRWARRHGQSLVAGAISGLSEGAWKIKRVHVFFVRTLSLHGKREYGIVERSISGAKFGAPCGAGVAGQRFTAKSAFFHDRRKHGWRRRSDGYEERAVAGGLHRGHDERKREREIFFSLHTTI